jgi:hypothetical protein
MNVLDLFRKPSPNGLSGSRLAVAIRWNDRIMVYAENLSASGRRIPSAPWIIASPEISDAELGHEIVSALRNSRKGVQDPADPDRIIADRCRFAGVRSEREFLKGAQYVIVQSDPEMIVLTPTRIALSGNDPGVHRLEDRKLEFPTDSPDEMIGKRVRRAWSTCSLL